MKVVWRFNTEAEKINIVLSAFSNLGGRGQTMRHRIIKGESQWVQLVGLTTWQQSQQPVIFSVTAGVVSMSNYDCLILFDFLGLQCINLNKYEHLSTNIMFMGCIPDRRWINQLSVYEWYLDISVLEDLRRKNDMTWLLDANCWGRFLNHTALFFATYVCSYLVT